MQSRYRSTTSAAQRARSRPAAWPRFWCSAVLALTLPATGVAQDGDKEPFGGLPGVLSLPRSNPWALNQVLVKHPGFANTPPSDATATGSRTPDFSESALLGGAGGLDIDGLSIGLDWILSDPNGRVPPPASPSNPNSWSWAGFFFTPGHTLVPNGTAPNSAILNERSRVDGAGSDVFFYILRDSQPPGQQPLGQFEIRLVADSPEIVLYNGNPSNDTAIDAFDLFAFFYLNDVFSPYLPQPPTVFFSITAASVPSIPPSWSIPAASQSGATIFKTTWSSSTSSWSTPTVYRSPASLGLAIDNDIDALAVDLLHNPEPYFLYSLDANVGPNSGPSAATSLSFGRASSNARMTYTDHRGTAIGDQIGTGVNIRSVCDIDPSRDALLRPLVGILKAPPFPWSIGTTRSAAWRDYAATGTGYVDQVRTILWSDPGCGGLFGPGTRTGAFVLQLEGSSASIGPIFIPGVARGGGAFFSSPWRGCPATIDIPLPPGIDLLTVGFCYYWADLNPSPLTVTLPLPKRMAF